ncbi:ABC transporter permease [Actinomycetospora sp. CA-053990]|uniref:ABC transporter permease n=1 Tax=Actinomycetospora sp. CA-053990 TaxID=3239891 RepID=UPI003D8D10D8
MIVDVDALVRLVVALVLLLLLLTVVLRLGGVRLGWAPITAVLRGAVQLTLVGLALGGVFAAPPLTAVVLLVMISTATWTATRRLQGLEGAGRAVVVSCVAGAAATLGIVFAVGVLPFSARYLVAAGGIVIGGTMTGATLAGRGLLSGLRARRDEVEAWLALGATSRQAARDVARTAAGEALVPAMDQTRTTGLVTLPGAFIGALLGGASPLDAARFQLVVLVALLAAQAIVAVLLTFQLGAPSPLPGDPPARR